MPYVVTENCIACKYMDCVEVCPVECFYEGENMLVIHPDQCIDCGICEGSVPPRRSGRIPKRDCMPGSTSIATIPASGHGCTRKGHRLTMPTS